jgi:hypothetical protein
MTTTATLSFCAKSQNLTLLLDPAAKVQGGHEPCDVMPAKAGIHFYLVFNVDYHPIKAFGCRLAEE